MPVDQVDLVVVGGGPAGLATAIGARLAGLSVTVLEKRDLPLDKACGEGLMPPGVRELERLGVRLPAGECRPFVGIRYLDGSTIAEGRFRSGPGLGVRRTALAGSMVARARSLGVDLRLHDPMVSWRRLGPGRIEATTAIGAVHGRLLVGADGLHSRVRRETGLEAQWSAMRRFGVRRHFSRAPWTDHVEVHWCDDAEAYVTPVGPELVGVALLWRGKDASFESLLGRFPALGERLRGAEPVGRARGAGPFHQRVVCRVADEVALVGDAAGYLDPLTGEGVTLGLRSARALVETVAAGAPLERYERAYRDLSRTYYRMTGLLLGVAARPWLRRRVVRLLARHPGLFSSLLALSAGEAGGGAVALVRRLARLTPVEL